MEHFIIIYKDLDGLAVYYRTFKDIDNAIKIAEALKRLDKTEVEVLSIEIFN